MSERTRKRELSLIEENIHKLRITRKRITSPINSKLLDVKDLVIIPQIGGTCWFNVIFTIILYSELARKIMVQEASKWVGSKFMYDELKQNKFKKFLFYMLSYNYTHPEKIAELFEKRLKAEFLILYFAEYYNVTHLKNALVKNLLNDLRIYSYSTTSFSDILRHFFVNPYDLLDICYYQGEIFALCGDTKTNLLTYVPKIIVLMNDKIFNFLQAPTINKIPIDDVTTGIINYENEITYNGHRYKLDACTMNNYNAENELKHAICGITYNNQGYVYNGWFDYKKTLNISFYKKFTKKTLCPLLPKDWKSDLRQPDYSAGFCLPPLHIENCTGLAELSASEKYCFDFSAKNANILLIYVLIDERTQQKTSNYEPSIASFISLKKISFTSRSLSQLFKTYYDFESKSLEELKIQLLKIYKNAQILVDELSSYKTFYFILTGERLSNYQITNEKEEVLKKLFIALLKIYIKDDKIFKLKILTDDKIYGYLEKEQIIELAVLVGYNRELITSFINSSIVFDEYLILYFVVMNNLTKEKNTMDMSLINLFIFHLCQYYLCDENAIKFELSYYKDKLIVDSLITKSILDLKSFIKPNENKSLDLLITKLRSINDELAFQTFITNPENKLLLEEFLNETSIIKHLQQKWFKELSLVGILILIIIEQYSLEDLYNLQKSTLGGRRFINNKNNYKKIKQLKNY
jgi:hypothetical protein